MSCEQIRPLEIGQVEYKKLTDNIREFRGFEIARASQIKTLDKDSFLVPSQTSKKTYKVTKDPSEWWVCTCPDFTYRKVICKHIHAILIWTKIRPKIQRIPATNIQQQDETKKCIFCSSLEIVRAGIRKNKFTQKQRFTCKSCSRFFVLDPFKKHKADGKVITLCMDLYFKGLSYRKIKDHLKQFYDLDVEHSTIIRWVKKFMKIINSYVEQFTPQTSDMWHADEMMIKVNGRYKWLWNSIDSDTRFMLANQITTSREIKDARALFKQSKDTAQDKPLVMVTDGLQSYREAFSKEFPKHSNTKYPEHIRYSGLTARLTNNKVERLNNTIRERDKVMRGLKRVKTAKEYTRSFKNYYNYIRGHQGLDGNTPAQQAGIELNLKINRWEDLVKRGLYMPTRTTKSICRK